MPIANGRTVDVEHATDVQFQAWVEYNSIPVDFSDLPEGKPAWSFDDRCGVINYVLSAGRRLHFANETIPEGA